MRPISDKDRPAPVSLPRGVARALNPKEASPCSPCGHPQSQDTKKSGHLPKEVAALLTARYARLSRDGCHDDAHGALLCDGDAQLHAACDAWRRWASRGNDDASARG